MPKIKTDKSERFIRECIRIALKGEKFVSPNPMVGCLIEKNGKIIGKGYHKKYGENHAEVNAILDAEKRGYDVKNSSLYVNLEPCSIQGKTPPCTDLIISKKIKNVFIGIKDPNPSVNGKGIYRLKKAGINVEYGILKNESSELNRYFIKSIKSKIPYISLKIAQSLDGKIALNNFKSKWITNEQARNYVKIIRGKYDAILIGHNTAVIDNPTLLAANPDKKPVYRIVLSGKPENIPDNHKLLTDKYSQNTILITSDISRYSFIKILKYLYSINISKIMVEGGAFVFSKFLKFGLYDDIYLFTSDIIIGRGISPFDNIYITEMSKSVKLKYKFIKRFGNTSLQYFTKL